MPAASEDTLPKGPRADPSERSRSTLASHDGALDGVRAVAVALVMLTHAGFLTGFTVSGAFLGQLVGRGDYGVHLFFALSAFLLHQRFLAAELHGRELSWGAYALRRCVRVLPAYWVVLLVVGVVTHVPVRSALLHVLALQVYVPDASIPAFSQAWSVATELSFYAALPLAVVGLGWIRRRWTWAPPLVLVLLAALSLGALATVGEVRVGEDVLPDRWLTGVAAVFLAGMLLAEVKEFPASGALSATLHRWALQPTTCLMIAGATYVLASTPVAGSLLLVPGHGPGLTVRILLGTIFALGLLLPLTLGGDSLLRRTLASRPLRSLGEISYGVFLWHVPVFFFLFWVSGAQNFRGGLVTLLVIGTPLSFLLGWLSHRLVEAPLIRWAARRRSTSGPR